MRSTGRSSTRSSEATARATGNGWSIGWAFEEGQWVREAAMAYAASISRRLSPKQHDSAGEESTDNEPTPQAQRSADKQQNSQPEGSDFQAEGGHGAVPTEGVATRGPQPVPAGSWPLWEVFVRAVAACLTITWEACTPLTPPWPCATPGTFTPADRRASRSGSATGAITATSPDEKDPFFEPAADKAYRHPTFYDIPGRVQM